MYRDQPEVIRIGILGNFLHFVSLYILNKHHVVAAVVQPTYEDKFVEHFRLRGLDHRGHYGKRISLPDWLIAVSFVADWSIVRSRCNPTVRRQNRQDEREAQTRS